MSNYFEAYTKEQNKETLSSLEKQMKKHQKQVDWYRRISMESGENFVQMTTCSTMIDYHQKEISKLLKVIDLLASEL